jgi:hypothetical protein
MSMRSKSNTHAHPRYPLSRIFTSGVQSSAQPTHPTFLQTMKDGFAVGLGSSLASRAVDSFLGPRKVEIQQYNCSSIIEQYKKALHDVEEVDSKLKENYDKCMKTN